MLKTRTSSCISRKGWDGGVGFDSAQECCLRSWKAHQMAGTTTSSFVPRFNLHSARFPTCAWRVGRRALQVRETALGRTVCQSRGGLLTLQVADG